MLVHDATTWNEFDGAISRQAQYARVQILSAFDHLRTSMDSRFIKLTGQRATEERIEAVLDEKLDVLIQAHLCKCNNVGRSPRFHEGGCPVRETAALLGALDLPEP